MIINDQIFNLGIFSAAVIWVFKSAYSKHMEEMRALAKYERMFIINMTFLNDNFEFIDKWIKTIESNHPFSFVFRSFYINDEDTFKLSNLSLIKKIIDINYKLKSISLDFDNFYRGYWDTLLKIDAMPDEKMKSNNLIEYNKTIKLTLQTIKSSQDPLLGELKESIAMIRAAANIRFHSLFGYINILFKDIYPTLNKSSIEKQIGILDNNINNSTVASQKNPNPVPVESLREGSDEIG